MTPKLRLLAQRLGAGVRGHPLVQSEVLMVLSWNCVLVYILRDTGIRGRVTSGRLEFEAGKGLSVYDNCGPLNEYISGARLRSWRVFYHGTPLPAWSQVMPEDAELLAREAF